MESSIPDENNGTEIETALNEFDEDLEFNSVNEEKNVDAPEIGMLFDSIDEISSFYLIYGKKLGFPVKRRTSKKGDDGVLKYITFACGRSGKSQSTSSNCLRPYPNIKTDCKAKISSCLCPDGRWRLNSCILEHNHDLSPSKARYFRCNRVINSHVKRQLEVNDRAGIRVNKSFNSFVVEAGGHENISFLEKDCRNYIEKVRRLRLGDGDAIAIQKYFLKMQSNNTNFFYSMDLDEDGHLKNVFWADARSREAYKEFGDVITFDTTYLTNKYDMPFAPFVGVNHHGQSTLLGCGLISSEDSETFVWLFQTWLACMLGRAPSGIITDQDKAMQKAIESVFSNVRHRWCLWHIMKKLPEKLKGYRQYEAIKYAMQNAVYDSQIPAEFEKSWSVMIDRYKLHNNEWLMGLYNERYRWVPSFVKNNFWAGMSTTQRSESMNAFFDGYVNAKTTLKQFVEQYGNALAKKVENESEADAKSFSQLVPCVTTYEMEKQFQIIYTIAKFKEFQEELTGKIYCDISSIKEDFMISEYDVEEDITIEDTKKRSTFKVLYHKNDCEVKCSCFRFEFKGILCRHAIAVLIRNRVFVILEKYVLNRWRKDVRRCHTRVKINYEGCNVTPEQLRYDKMCNAFSKFADLVADDEKRHIGVLEWIENETNKLPIKRGTCESSQPTPILSIYRSSNNESTVISKESQNILNPVSVRGKGRPPFKRKQSMLEQTGKRKINKGKKNKDTQSIAPSNYKDNDVNGTQESNTINSSYNLKCNVGVTDCQYPTSDFCNTNMGLLFGVTPKSHANFGNVHFQDQQQFWNSGYGMYAMPRFGYGDFGNLSSSTNQLEGDCMTPTETEENEQIIMKQKINSPIIPDD